MKIYSNERRIKLMTVTATSINFSGLAMLAISTYLAFTQPSSVAYLPVMSLGILFSIFGTRMVKRWIQQPTPHDAIPAGLRGLGKKARLYQYYPPAHHLLITDFGVFSLSAQPVKVSVSIDGEIFKNRAAFFKRIIKSFSQDTLNLPVHQAFRDAKRAQDWLDKNLPDHGIAVQPVIVFTNPRAEFEIVNEPAVPVTYSDKRKPSLKTYIREQSFPTLTPGLLAQLDDMLNISK
jgi:hypothetical protein